jgi:hypothetical protein
LAELSVREQEPHPEDPTMNIEMLEEPPGIEHEAMISEFESFMVQRFLSGEDTEFVDYSEIDNDDTVQLSKWSDQDREAAYFADVDDD